MSAALFVSGLIIAQALASPRLPPLAHPDDPMPERLAPAMEALGYHFAACRAHIPSAQTSSVVEQLEGARPNDITEPAWAALKLGYENGQKAAALNPPSARECERLANDAHTSLMRAATASKIEGEAAGGRAP